MFFRRAKKDDLPAAILVAEEPMPAPALAPVAPSPAPPQAKELIDEDATGAPDFEPVPDTVLNFSTTDDIEATSVWLGQEHVVQALQCAWENRGPGFHVCVVADSGVSAHAALLKLIKEQPASAQPARDWVYVNNFDDERRPHALALSSGHGKILAEGMLEALSELSEAVPAVLTGDEFKVGVRLIAERYEATKDNAITQLRYTAGEQNIALLRTPNGFGLAPMHDGKVVRPVVFAQLPQSMRGDIEARIADLQAQLQDILKQTPAVARAQHADLLDLRTASAQRVVDAAFADLAETFATTAEAASFIGAAKACLVRNCDVFLGADAGTARGPVAIAQDARFHRYLVNVVSRARSPAGAPVVMFAETPLANSHSSTHMSLNPDALIDANGGALFVTSFELEYAPEAARALKHALLTGEIIPSHPTLRPAAIPLDVNVVLLTDARGLDRLQAKDPIFASLFKLRVRCADRLERSPDNDLAFASWVAGLVARDRRLPLTAAAVSALMKEITPRGEESSLCQDRNGEAKFLSIAEDDICDVLAAAHLGALLAEDKVIDAGHIRHVFAQRAAQVRSNGAHPS